MAFPPPLLFVGDAKGVPPRPIALLLVSHLQRVRGGRRRRLLCRISAHPILSYLAAAASPLFLCTIQTPAEKGGGGGREEKGTTHTRVERGEEEEEDVPRGYSLSSILGRVSSSSPPFLPISLPPPPSPDDDGDDISPTTNTERLDPPPPAATTTIGTGRVNLDTSSSFPSLPPDDTYLIFEEREEGKLSKGKWGRGEGRRGDPKKRRRTSSLSSSFSTIFHSPLSTHMSGTTTFADAFPILLSSNLFLPFKRE